MRVISCHYSVYQNLFNNAVLGCKGYDECVSLVIIHKHKLSLLDLLAYSLYIQFIDNIYELWHKLISGMLWYTL